MHGKPRGKASAAVSKSAAKKAEAKKPAPKKKAVAKKKTVLVIVAHADDMEFMAAGTVARFVFEKGYDVYEYILTDNSKGSYRLPPHELVETSAREAREAGRVLS